MHGVMRLSTNLSILLLAASLAFTGCKKKDTTSAPPTEGATPAASGAPITSDDDYVKRGVALVDQTLGIFKAAGTNCDKLADDITKLATDSKPQVKASKEYEKTHPDVKKKFDEATKAQQAAFETVAAPTITACKDNKKLGEALNKLVAE